MLSAGSNEIPRWGIKVRLVRENLPERLDGFFAGDTETDIRAAKALNLEAIGIANGIRTQRFLLAAEPMVLLRSISQLPKYLQTRGL